MATESDELVLLERVFLRIGSAETDEQLQNVLDKFLPPVLLKLSSQQAGVRNKVMALLVHVNKRVKSRPLVRLPVSQLLEQYRDPESTSFVINFTIIYLKLGFPRLTPEEQVELVPAIINSLENKPQTHQDSLLLLIIPVLGKVKVPTDPAKRTSLFGLNEKPRVSKDLLSLLLDMLLLPYGALSPPSTSNSESNTDVSLPVPPGMSEYTFKRVTTDPIKPEELEQIKLGIVKFLASEIFSNEDILIHLIVAAADTRFSVANLADMELKKVIGFLDWGAASVSMPLYDLFLGTQIPNVKPNLKKCPANTRIRLKLLTYLCRVSGNGFINAPAFHIIYDTLYGTNTNSRLKTLALNFTCNLVRGANNSLSKVANILKLGMVRLINEEEAEKQHQIQAFIILGMLCQRFPIIVYHDATNIELFIRKVEAADPETRLQIKEGALNMIAAFKYDIFPDAVDKNDRLTLLFSLLKSYMKSEEPIVRFIVVRGLATIFPPEHVPSKYLLLLATGDNNDDVFMEALKTLYGTSRKIEVNMSNKDKLKDSPSTTLPSFVEITKYIYEESQACLKDSAQRCTVGNNVIAFPVKVYIEMLIYLRLCLTQSLDVPLTREVIRHPSEDTPIVRKYLQGLYNNEPIKKNPLLQYANLVKDLLIANPGVESLCCMIEVIGCVPQLHTILSKDIQWLRDLLNSVKEEIREHSALLYSLVLNEQAAEEEFNSAIKYLIAQTSTKSLEGQNGSILGIGNCLERRIMTKKVHNKNMDGMEAFDDGVNALIPFLSNGNALLLSPACVSIGLIGKSCALPLPLEEEKNGSPHAKRPTTALNTKLTLVNKLLDVMNNTKLSAKCREKAAKALGLICVGENFPYTKEVIEGLLNTVKETKDVEVHFTIGESLVMCVQGIWSPEARDPWLVSSKDHLVGDAMQVDASDENLEWLVLELLNYASGLHPNSKQASCIWLLALLKSCVDRDPIKNRLKVLQGAFMDLLGENNDIVQDAASKGLCLIYDYSKSEELLTALVEQLTTGRRQAVQVTDDTKLFEEGQLGKTPTGGNLSTYKELCSLASELNKPDLIYQFMHLANHNAIWNSKKGAAFGFSSIAEKCGEHLQQHLPNIIPKLYRYQYDPSPNLQASMQNIWHTLVQEPTKMLDLYHKEILAELLSNLTSNQYRVRQSCCFALQDFLKGAGNRSIHDSVGAMDELWSKLFRVMDDHHEQTRIAATKTTKILSKLCIRGCDLSQGKDAVAMMDAILPVLLSNGISNPVADVRLISLQTISELVGSAGKQLKPFLPKLIPALLLATGELESNKLSYLSTMYGAQSNVQEAVDSVRASMAKSHFTTETVSKCLQYADSSILEELVPKVTELMKGSIGLGTRVVCAHFITLLTLQLRKDLQPYAGKFLAALVNGLTDRNSSIRKNYASAIGHLVGVAKESSLEKLFAKIKLWYFEREDDSIRSACALTIQSIGTHNQEILKNHSEEILPLVFFAMHAEKKVDAPNSLEIWNEIWAEHSPGTESGIRQNLEVICDTLKTALESPSWTMKAQAANAISTVANKLGETFEAKHRNGLINTLLEVLKGRTWNGKDKLLVAIASICSNCKDSLKEDKEIDIDTIITVMLKEARKEEIVYKISALETLGNILSSLELDRFEDIYNIVETILSNETTKTDEDEISTEEMSSKRENNLKLKEVVYDLLGKAWPKGAKETQRKYNTLFVEHCVKSLPISTRNIQVAIVVALCSYVDKLCLLSGGLDNGEEETLRKIIEELMTALSYSFSISKHTRLRKEALNVFYSLAKRLKENGPLKQFEELSEAFKECLQQIGKDNQPEIKFRLIDLKKVFQYE